MRMEPKLLNQTRSNKLYVSNGRELPWQYVYRQLRLNKVKNVTSYQVNGNLYIVVPVGKEGNEQI
jgi:hypothetical protein